jgi:hypothetical protein
VHAGASSPAKREHRAWARSLKTQQCSYTELDVVLGELVTGRNEFHRRPSSPRS